MRICQTQQSSARGFSLIELMVVVVMITLVLGAVLAQVKQVQQRATAEQGRVDDFQQARDFTAQIVRDGRQMGYPNIHNFDISTWTAPYINNSQAAVGLVKLTSTELDFEGDVDGSGTISEVSYKVNGDGLCAQCMERAQIPKITGNPLAQALGIAATNYVQDVQNVQNSASATDPIFSAYDAQGNAIALPIDMTNNTTTVPQVRLIRVALSVANPTSIDPQTGRQLEAEISGNIQVVNCSMVATESQLQAVSVTIPGNVQLTCQ